MLRELSDSIKASIYEKSVSPLFGAYVGAWSVCNWRLISYYILSDDSITDKISFIESNYINPWANYYWPAIISVVFLLVYPVISTAAYSFWEFFSALKARVRFIVGSKVPMDMAESIELKKRLHDRENEISGIVDDYKKRSKGKDQEITALHQEIT